METLTFSHPVVTMKSPPCSTRLFYTPYTLFYNFHPTFFTQLLKNNKTLLWISTPLKLWVFKRNKEHVCSASIWLQYCRKHSFACRHKKLSLAKRVQVLRDAISYAEKCRHDKRTCLHHWEFNRYKTFHSAASPVNLFPLQRTQFDAK